MGKIHENEALIPVLGASFAMALFVFQPLTKELFPNAPWAPGALMGSVFGLLWAYKSFISTSGKQPCLSKTEFKEFKLIEKQKISPNTAIYKYALPTKDSVLGLPIGQHISIGAVIDGKEIVRSYTPVSSDEDKGYFELLIKTYPNGNISKYVDEMKIGDHLRVKGPKGFFVYTPNMCTEIGMIAGGTGITPMLQIIKAIVKNPSDKTKVSLIFANVNQDDILLKSDLDDIAKNHPDRFKVYYVLNNPPTNWKGGVGFVTKDMISEQLPAYKDSVKLLLCGPPPMIKAMTGYAEELGYPKAQAISKLPDAIFKF